MLRSIVLLFCIGTSFASTKYAVNHTVTLTGIPAGTFNGDANVKFSLNSTILTLLSKEDINHGLSFFHACKAGMVPTKNVKGNIDCSGKSNQNLLLKNNTVVHYQVKDIVSYKKAVDIMDEMSSGTFQNTGAFAPVVSAIKSWAIKTIERMDAVRSIGNISVVANALPSTNPTLIACNFSYYCKAGIPANGNFCQQPETENCVSCNTDYYLKKNSVGPESRYWHEFPYCKKSSSRFHICTTFGFESTGSLGCVLFETAFYLCLPLWVFLSIAAIWWPWSKFIVGPWMRRQHPFHWELMYGKSSNKILHLLSSITKKYNK